MSENKVYVFAGGGSGGHLFPGLAAAEALKRLEPEAEVIFLATERAIDERILKDSGFRYVKQGVQPLPRSLGQLWRFVKGWRSSVRYCRELFGRERVAAVLGLGGFASGPGVYVAQKLKIPIGMLNPDFVPGVANQQGGKLANRIFVQWSESAKYFGAAGSKCVETGCPIREGMVTNIRRAKDASEREAMRRSLGLDAAKKILLVMGGSQGGRTINQAIVSCLQGPAKGWSERWQVVHLTGEADHGLITEQYEKTAWRSAVWAFCDRMDVMLPLADLVVGRSGASSLAELTAAGVGSLLMPYPYHKDQHQLRNAEILERAGAAKIVTDDPADASRTAARLSESLLGCLSSLEVVTEMGCKAAGLGKPNAAEAVAKELIAMGKK